MSNLPTRLSNSLYDDMWLPEETIAVRDKVRKFAEQTLQPLAHELNTTPEDISKFPWKLNKSMGEAGLFAIPFEKEFGGAGLELSYDDFWCMS